MAASSDPATSQKGIRWLRAYSDDVLLLRACYWSPSFERDMVGSVVALFTDQRVYPDQARTIYYRVKGTAFNALPPPPSLRRHRRWLDEWDFDQGGTTVGQRVRGLRLLRPRIRIKRSSLGAPLDVPCSREPAASYD